MPGILDFTTQAFSYRTVARKAAAYTVLVTDEYVQMEGAYTATLPPLNSLQGTTYAQKAYKIENIGTADVTIQPGTNTVTNTADTIDGRATYTLKPGESTTVHFKLGPKELQILDRDMHWTVEPGAFDIMVGSSSAQTTSIPLQVVAR